MGRLIDVDAVKKRFPIMENDFGMVINDRLHKELDKIPTVEAIPKADYEARLKADLEAILVELQLEIEEKEQYYQDEFLKSKNAIHDAAMCGRMFGCGECKEIIQQKIDKLKGVETE